MVAVVASGLAAPAVAGDLGRAPCRCPAELVALEGALPHSAAETREHHTLRIVALGSSSTYGTGASSEAATYPRRLEVELGTMLPGVRLEVINKGVPGEIAADMVARLDRDVLGLMPDLVVWQTGTNDALRDVPVADFTRLTVEAIARLHAAGIDVILMEPQYSPKLVARPHYAEYIQALRAIGHDAGAPVVRRFDIMRAWTKSGQFVDATMLQQDWLHMKDASYACLGWVVAESIAEAIGPKTHADALVPAPRPAAQAASRLPAAQAASRLPVAHVASTLTTGALPAK
jgi:lysophospholipase L1-like esterase